MVDCKDPSNKKNNRFWTHKTFFEDPTQKNLVPDRINKRNRFVEEKAIAPNISIKLRKEEDGSSFLIY